MGWADRGTDGGQRQLEQWLRTLICGLQVQEDPLIRPSHLPSCSPPTFLIVPLFCFALHTLNPLGLLPFHGLVSVSELILGFPSALLPPFSSLPHLIVLNNMSNLPLSGRRPRSPTWLGAALL